jgi:hypothetical protein
MTDPTPFSQLAVGAHRLRNRIVHVATGIGYGPATAARHAT